MINLIILNRPKENRYTTTGGNTNSGPSGIYYFQPVCYFYDGKYYYCYNNSTNDQESTILHFDQFLRYIETEGVGVDTPGGTDGHKHPSIIVTDNDVLIQVHERLNDPPDPYTHNSDLLVRAAINKDDLSQGFTDPVVISGTFSYPHLCKVGGNIFIIAREGSEREAHIYKSTNDGASWVKIGEIYNVPNDRLYKYQLCNPNEDKLTLACMHRTVGESNQPYTFVGYLESDDGDTWYNAGRTWSKKISTAGIISFAELRTNAAVWDVEDDAGEHVISYSGFCSPDGTPVLMAELGDNGSALYTFQINSVEVAFWNGSSWTKTALPLTHLPETTSYANDAKYFIHGKKNGNTLFFFDNENVIKYWESSDNINWIYRGVFRSPVYGSANYMHTVVYNKYIDDRLGGALIGDTKLIFKRVI